MDNDFCDNLLGINLDTYDTNFDIAPTVPITPGQADLVSSSYQPVMSYGGASYESIYFHQQQQHLMGGAGTSAEVGGITQPMLSEALPPNTITFDPKTATTADNLDSADSMVRREQYHFKATVAKGGVSGRGKQFKFVEKNNMLYVKPKKSIPFSFSTAVSVPTGCWVRAMVIFASEVVAKQCGAVRRCPNHISEDRQAATGQLANVEHFIQSRMNEAVYFMMAGHYCVSVPFDKLVDGVCLFSFACYNSCLEYKDDSCRKGKLVKPGLQVLFTLVDANQIIIGEDSIDLRVCACPTRDAPVNYSCHSNNARTRKQSLGIKHHRNRKRSNHHKKQQQLSLESLVKQVQETDELNKEDIVDEKAGLFKFTCFAPTKEQYQLLCTIRAAFQQQ